MARYSVSDISAAEVAVPSRHLIDALLPPTLVLHADDRVCFCHGDLRPFLLGDGISCDYPQRNRPEPAQLSSEPARLTKAHLPPRIRVAVDRCRLDGERQEVEQSPPNGRSGAKIRVTIRPLFHIAPALVAVSFEEAATPRRRSSKGQRRIAELEQELAEARRALRQSEDRLQALGRDLDSSHRQYDLATNELLASSRALRESDQRKGEYLAMLGHELRNPLAAIAAATEMAKLCPGDDPRLKKAIGVLERQSQHVSQIVDGLLEVSRIARGKIELERKPLNVVEVLAAVLQDRLPHFEKRKLELQQSLPDEEICVEADQVRLVQIFDNLIGNALRFTLAPGAVSVSVTVEAEEAVIRVADTGVGIRAEMLERIFEPFLQENQDVARATGGLGLGLSLAKSLTELHGGSIEARSPGPGKGAEFVVRLPLCRNASLSHTHESHRGPGSRRVLIVEDNADAADTLASLLELKGHQVRIARSAREALGVLQTHARHNRGFDLVLCDIGLPGMSGYELAQVLRADNRTAGGRLVAVTGYGQPEDRQRSLEAGFDEHLTKPLGPEVLERLLQSV